MRIWNPALAAVTTCAGFAWAGLGALVFLDPEQGEAPHGWSVCGAAGLVASGMYLAVRGWFVGLTIASGTVVKRGWLRRRRLTAQDVRKVRIAPYEGWLAGDFGRDRRLRMLELVLVNDVIPLPELAAYARRSRRMHRQVLAALGLDDGGESSPRHAAGE